MSGFYNSEQIREKKFISLSVPNEALDPKNA